MVSSFKSCYKCTDRTEACHSTCKKYIDEKAEHNKRMEAKRASSNKEYRDYTRSKVSKIERASRRKYGKT